MPRSYFATFADPLQQASAMRGAEAEFLCMSREFEGSHLAVDFDRVWTMSNTMKFTGIARASAARHRIPIGFMPGGETGSLRVQNLDLVPGEILMLRREGALNFKVAGTVQFATASLAAEDLAITAKAIAGHDIELLPDARILRPDPPAMDQLVKLHRAAGRLARRAPGVLAKAGVSKALEQKLVHTIVRCLTAPTIARAKRENAPHSRIIRRFEDFLAANQYQPVYLAEICAGIGVAERTLRSCCQDHFGMGQVRYLWLRRMHLAFRAMGAADAQSTSVTEIATEYGFWELGRFSVEYRALFGESPSATLHRPPVSRNAAATAAM
jgi:AraC-like DNA-binding protein